MSDESPEKPKLEIKETPLAPEAAAENIEKTENDAAIDITKFHEVLRNSNLKPEIKNKYLKNYDDFIKDKNEGFKNLENDTKNELEKIYSELAGGKEEEKKEGEEKFIEKLEKEESKLPESPDGIDIEEEKIDISSPEKVFESYEYLSNVEDKFVTEAQSAYEFFDEAQKAIFAANEEGRNADIFSWAWSKFKDSDAKKKAEKALESIREKYKKTVDKNKKRNEVLQKATKKVLTAADKSVKDIENRLNEINSHRKDYIGPKKIELEKLTKEAEKIKNDFSGQHARLDEIFQRDVSEIQKAADEIQKKLDEIEKQKQEILVRKQEVEAKLEAVERGDIKEDKKSLSEQVKSLDKAYTNLEDQENALIAQRKPLDDKRAKIEETHNNNLLKFNEQEGEVEKTYSALEEGKNKLHKDEDEINLEEGSLKDLAKNAEESTSAMKTNFDAWEKGNGEIIKVMEQQKSDLNKTEARGPTLFNSIYNTPVLGKWGAIGLATLPGRGIEAGWNWIGEKTGAGKWWEENKRSLSVLGGFMDGCKSLTEGIISISAHPTDVLDGVVDLAAHPSKLADVGKAIIQYDEFKNSNIAYGIGKIIPDIALVIASYGTGAAVSGGTKAGQIGKTLLQGMRSGLANEAGRITVGSVVKGVAWKAPKAVVVGAGKLAVNSGRMGYEIIKMPLVAIKRTSRMFTGFKMGLRGEGLKQFMKGEFVAEDIVTKIPHWRVFERGKLKREAGEVQKKLDELQSFAKTGAIEKGVFDEIDELTAHLKKAEYQLGGELWKKGIKAISVEKKVSFIERVKEYSKAAEPIKAKRKIAIESRSWKELSKADTELWKLKVKYAKEGIIEMPAVKWAKDIPSELRLMTQKGLAGSKEFIGKLPDLVKSIPDKITREKILGFMKKSITGPVDFLRIIASDFMIIPPKFRVLIMDPKLSLAEKFVGIVKEYPQIMLLIKTTDVNAITPQKLARELEKIIENDMKINTEFEKLEDSIDLKTPPEKEAPPNQEQKKPPLQESPPRPQNEKEKTVFAKDNVQENPPPPPS